MSSNNIVGLPSPSSDDEVVEYKEIFDQFRNIAERIEIIGNKF